MTFAVKISYHLINKLTNLSELLIKQLLNKEIICSKIFFSEYKLICFITNWEKMNNCPHQNDKTEINFITAK